MTTLSRFNLVLLKGLSVREELASLIAGTAFTVGIFYAMAHLERVEPVQHEPELLDLRAMPATFEAPPPKPLETVQQVEAVASPLTGVEIAPSDSPVKIAVVPVDLAALFPEAQLAPPAMIRFGKLDLAIKARMDVTPDLQHVYQQNEVDERPTVLERGTPRVPQYVRKGAKELRVVTIIQVDRDGLPKNVRILSSSGNTPFDEIVKESIRRSWVFAPAMKNKKRVQCLIQQSVVVRWAGGSSFEVSP